MKVLKNICFYIVIATAITAASNYFETSFLFTYLKRNIIGLLLTLLAINTATLGLIASKIQEIISASEECDFSKTIREMKFSLKEQIFLIGFSIILLIICDSIKIIFICKESICKILLTSILVYSIDILWDTGKSIFVIIEETNKKK